MSKENYQVSNAVEIILGDEEIRRIFQSLIQLATDKKYGSLQVGKALAEEWKRTVSIPSTDYTLSDDEKNYISKISKFIEEYSDDLTKAYNNIRGWRRHKVDRNDTYKFFKFNGRMRIYIAAGYCIFCHNDTFNVNNTRVYGVNSVGAHPYYGVTRDEVDTLVSFFNHLTFPQDPGSRPKYELDIIYKPVPCHISVQESYNEFIHNNVARRTDLTMGIMSAIWFINKYY